MSDAVLNFVAEAGNRRMFVRRASKAALLVYTGLLGVTPESYAYNYHGCNLCKQPGGCNGSSGCNWCWWATNCHCSSNGKGHRNYCCERWDWDHPQACTDGCDAVGVICSYLGGSEPCSIPCGPQFLTGDLGNRLDNAEHTNIPNIPDVTILP